ncbi:MAG: transglycosylase SLT domain-containing protein [Muribaculaceae bacterium]|nr:transglycosylase SLT domain-containing protein [Muribaculaceae bacterium]
MKIESKRPFVGGFSIYRAKEKVEELKKGDILKVPNNLLGFVVDNSLTKLRAFGDEHGCVWDVYYPKSKFDVTEYVFNELLLSDIDDRITFISEDKKQKVQIIKYKKNGHRFGDNNTRSVPPPPSYRQYNETEANYILCHEIKDQGVCFVPLSVKGDHVALYNDYGNDYDKNINACVPRIYDCYANSMPEPFMIEYAATGYYTISSFFDDNGNMISDIPETDNYGCLQDYIEVIYLHDTQQLYIYSTVYDLKEVFLPLVSNNKDSNLLSPKKSIIDNAIVYPSSFETDTKAMMENWYLKNYAVIDQNSIDNRDYGEVSDKVYIQRLKDISISIEMPFNQIVKSYIERYVKRGRTLVAQMLGMGKYYMPIFEEALERHQLPLELKYIPIIESGLNPNAVSSAGASGLWQLMPSTAKKLGLEVNSMVDECRDPYRSSEKAAKIFKQLFDTYHDWSLCIAAYNCGTSIVNKAIQRTGSVNADFWEIYNYLPKETRGYVPAFIAANYIMHYYREHGISPIITKPLVIDTVMVNYGVDFSQIAKVLNIPIEEIRIFNPQYCKDVIPGTPSHPYSLALPSQQIYSYIMVEKEISKYNSKQFEGRSPVQSGDVKTIVDDEVVDDRFLYHEVVEGENLTKIAKRYGVSVDVLKKANELKDDNIRIGTKLIVPKNNKK